MEQGHFHKGQTCCVFPMAVSEEPGLRGHTGRSEGGYKIYQLKKEMLLTPFLRTGKLKASSRLVQPHIRLPPFLAGGRQEKGR